MPRIFHEIRGKYIWIFMPQYLRIMVCYQITFQKLFKNDTCITFCINSVFLILTVADMITTEGTLKTDSYDRNRKAEEEVKNAVTKHQSRPQKSRKGDAGISGRESNTQRKAYLMRIYNGTNTLVGTVANAKEYGSLALKWFRFFGDIVNTHIKPLNECQHRIKRLLKWYVIKWTTTTNKNKEHIWIELGASTWKSLARTISGVSQVKLTGFGVSTEWASEVKTQRKGRGIRCGAEGGSKENETRTSWCIFMLHVSFKGCFPNRCFPKTIYIWWRSAAHFSSRITLLCC